MPAGSISEIEATTVAEVWPALALGDEPSGLLYAVNKTYASADRVLEPPVTRWLCIPPVSGGGFLLSEDPLSLDRAVRRGARRPRRSDRDVHRDDAHRVARP